MTLTGVVFHCAHEFHFRFLIKMPFFNCQACEQIQSPAEEVRCQLCPAGSFSETLDSGLCRPHASCEAIGRKVVTPGTATSDATCGDCLPG